MPRERQRYTSSMKDRHFLVCEIFDNSLFRGQRISVKIKEPVATSDQTDEKLSSTSTENNGVRLTNLPLDTTVEELNNLFRAYTISGKILLYGKGKATIYFGDERSALLVCREFNNSLFKGERITVRIKEPATASERRGSNANTNTNIERKEEKDERNREKKKESGKTKISVPSEGLEARPLQKKKKPQKKERNSKPAKKAEVEEEQKCQLFENCNDYECRRIHSQHRMCCAEAMRCDDYYCAKVHPKQRKRRCRFGKDCSNDDCEFLHPIATTQQECPIA